MPGLGWEAGQRVAGGRECVRELFPLFLFQKDKSSLVLSGKQHLEAQLQAPGIIVPPPSPVHFFEQLNSEFLPFWNQSDTLPQYLLNE